MGFTDRASEKEGQFNSFRFCVDYRKLNDVTHKDAYPLPRIDDTLNTLASKWFSTLDLILASGSSRKRQSQNGFLHIGGSVRV